MPRYQADRFCATYCSHTHHLSKPSQLVTPHNKRQVILNPNIFSSSYLLFLKVTSYSKLATQRLSHLKHIFQFQCSSLASNTQQTSRVGCTLFYLISRLGCHSRKLRFTHLTLPTIPNMKSEAASLLTQYNRKQIYSLSKNIQGA